MLSSASMRQANGQLAFSATDLSSHLACNHLTSLRRGVACGELEPPLPYDDPRAEVLRQRGLDPVAVAARTRDAMRRGADVIYQRRLEDVGGRWSGYPDFLLRVDLPSALGGWSYEVLDAKLARRAKGEALLQLLLYSDLLAQAQGIEPELMHLALGGGGESSASFRVAEYAAYYRAVRRRFEAHVASPPDTYPESVDHCGVCEWKQACAERRRADDHLSLVVGITRGQRARVAEREVTTMAALGALRLPVSPRLDGIGEAALARIRDYGAYETTAVKRLMSRYATREDEVDRLLRGRVFVDLHRVVRQGLRASVESYSLKALEPFYGFARARDLATATRALVQVEARLENHRPQPGRVFLGDGDGGFRRAPADLFPVDTLNTVLPRKAPFGDLNGDGRPDMFLAVTGWDAEPWHGEQNRLYLSRPGGGWRDATSELPPLSDYSHSAAIGDIRGVGRPDILVGNYGGGIDNEMPYVLQNHGGEAFALDRSTLPAGPGETLNFDRIITFTGTVLADLDGDALPELVALGEGFRGYYGIDTVSYVFWNRGGAFREVHKTPLPSPAVYARHGHIDLDAAALDADGDGLRDLVVVGTQLEPFYDGWFVQLLMNRGDGTFTDETAIRLQPHEQSSGNPGVATGAPWARWVEAVDFNGDGAADFVMNVMGFEDHRPNQPLVWLNDGRGRFSALKVHDFVRPGEEWLLYGARLVRTRHGYSYIHTQSYPGSGGLILTGLLANRPYR